MEENEITHVFAVETDTDGLNLFIDEGQAKGYAARFGLNVKEEMLMNRSAAAQFLIDTYDAEN